MGAKGAPSAGARVEGPALSERTIKRESKGLS